MCGFCGFVGFRNMTTDTVIQTIKTMSATISHRGPDDSGVWCDQETEIVFGHQRLAIQDLSKAGGQPMLSNNGRYVIVFNGEIYNHKGLRAEISKTYSANKVNQRWHGHSDTETLLACFEAWGVKDTLNKLSGMFAFALWDKEEKTLYLSRDRFGEKPLYYGFQNGVFLFSSELKALRKHPSFEGVINRKAVALQMRYNYIPTPFCVYENIYKLEPGKLMIVKDGAIARIENFWSADDAVINGKRNPFSGSELEAVSELDALLTNSVQEQMISDLEVGAFLSGGIDSSLIAAIMQKNSTKKVKTFSIGFEENGFDESPYAKTIAQHIGSSHSELYVSAADALNVIPKLPEIYDEPFSDSSQIPTFLVSKLAKSKVTVALSGDAGDELFCGYNRYLFTEKLFRRLEPMPYSLRLLTAYLLENTPAMAVNSICNSVSTLFSGSRIPANMGDKLLKSTHLLRSAALEDVYGKLISHWPNPEDVVLGCEHFNSDGLTENQAYQNISNIEKMMLLDTKNYLPDDILVKVDRAAMSVSLETRIPFLNKGVFEFAWSLPQSMKVKNGESKWVLRQLLKHYIPGELFERPKMGFGIPIGQWLRGPLRDWAEGLLCENRLRAEGILEPNAIRKKWAQHVSGRQSHQYQIWNVLMFQAWLEQESKN